MIKDIKFSNKKENTVSRYIMPQAIALEKDVQNAAVLLKEQPRQALVFGDIEFCTIKKGGYVVLDMGCEIHGGADITFEKHFEHQKTVRITFGESIMEALSTLGVKNATNDHSTRDFVFGTKSAMNIKYGNTGYRFIKVEALECDIYIKSVQGIIVYRDIEYLGSFECNDEKINKIWQVGAYTTHLNMQEYLWDGIKRDRLVWMGDTNPEILTICSVFGYNDVVPKSMDLIMEATPLDKWMNNTPTYTSWWLVNQYDWYMQNGDLKYLAERQKYIFETIKKIIRCVSNKGELSYPEYFCDWSSKYTDDEIIGAYAVTLLGLKSGAKLCGFLGNDELKNKCETAVRALLKRKFELFENKQTAALYALSGGADCKEITEKLLIKNGAHGLSTFLGGYVLRAMKNGRYGTDAMKIMREYWGAMLDYGATTFWEDFDIDWVTDKTVGIDKVVPDGMLDIHGDCGKFCYTQFRHSLCHGWASGPTSFLSQCITGIEILEPGCKKVRIKPDLCGLEYIKTKYPTPFGIIEAEAEKSCTPKITVPNGIKLVK
ncbi:MAG: hypothetical protein SOX82_08695 [Eubacteriales bacterium]|nr:hypothetical protein [Eubacteriales bacterium]